MIMVGFPRVSLFLPAPERVPFHKKTYPVVALDIKYSSQEPEELDLPTCFLFLGLFEHGPGGKQGWCPLGFQPHLLNVQLVSFLLSMSSRRDVLVVSWRFRDLSTRLGVAL